MVASVHDNLIGNNLIGLNGRCSSGDQWSSEDGNLALSKVGADSWSNRRIFGTPQDATSDDFKNPAYFELNAKDIMIWQVPNETPLKDFDSAAYLKYFTNSEPLQRYGGNLYSLYKDHFPIVSGQYFRPADNGPAIPVVFAKGTADELVGHFGTIPQTNTESGYIQVSFN